MQLERVVETGRRDTLANQLRDALVALAGIAVAVVAIVAVTAVVALSGVQIAGLLGPLALVGTLAVAFLPIFVVFPTPAWTYARRCRGRSSPQSGGRCWGRRSPSTHRSPGRRTSTASSAARCSS